MQRKLSIRCDENEYEYGYGKLFNLLSGNYVTIDAKDDKNYIYAYGTNLEETKDVIKLIFNGIKFDKDTKTFSEDEVFSFEFNKNSNEGKINNLPENIWETKRSYSQNLDILITPDSLDNISLYIASVVNCNANVSNYFEKIASTYAHELGKNQKSLYSPSYFVFNTLRFITENLIEIEKLITSENTDFLLGLMKEPKAKLQKGKKLHQVIDIPSFALDYMKKNDLLGAKRVMQNIASEFDGNTLKIIIDMFESFIPYEKYDSKRVTYSNNPVTKKISFLENIYILLQKKYKISDLLNYLLKQRMYWSYHKNFGFPYEEAKTLIDYINICEKYGLSCEKYPQNLTKNHDIVVKNIDVLDSDTEKQEAFENAVKDYYSSDIEVGDYVFTAPKTIKDLVFEGDSLHHCIGNYSDSIISGVSRIYFMREKKDPKKSFVTIELNKDNNLVEFEGDYNVEPTDADVKTAINNFVKKVKKGGI